MAGNVGVQSSAIIVQGLANDDIKGSISNRLMKEMLLALIERVYPVLLTAYFYLDLERGFSTHSLAISISLIAVIVVAGFRRPHLCRRCQTKEVMDSRCTQQVLLLRPVMTFLVY